MATLGTTAFPFSISPLNNIQPFTYRDGMSHLGLLERLRVYVNDTLRVEFNDEMGRIISEFNAGIVNAETTITNAQAGWQASFNAFVATTNATITQLTADIEAEKVGWQASFDAFMDDVVAQLAGLNDLSISELLEDTESATFGSVATSVVKSFTPNRDAYSGPAPTVWENLGYVLSLTDMRAAMASKLKKTIYQPCVIRIPDGTAGKLGDYYAYWSTDHDNNTGGVWMAYADHPEGPWTWYPHPNGWTFADTGSGRGNQTETFFVIRFLNTFWGYYQQKGAPAGLGVQTTLVASSPDGLTWTKLDKGLLWPSLDLPGDGHTGYGHFYVMGNRIVAFSSASGTNYSRQCIWHSMDAQNFTLDKNLFVINISQSQNNVERLVWSPRLFEWRGDVWGSFVIKSSSSGLDDPSTNQAFVAKIRKDFQGIDGPMYPTQAAGSCYIEHEGELYTFGTYYNKADLNDNTGGMQVSRLVTK